MALPGSGRQQRMKTGVESSRRRRPSLVQVKPVSEWDVGVSGTRNCGRERASQTP